MQEQYHIIQQQIFDISFPVRDKAHELQNRISNFFNTSLSREMDKLFSRLIPADRVVKLNNLVIDAGSMPPHWLDEDLEERILAALEKEIMHLLSSPYNSMAYEKFDSIIQPPAKTNYLALLAHFLLTGTVPWWATGDVLTDPLKVFNRLLTEDAESLKKLILDTGKFAYVRKRLVYQFSEKIIRDVIQLLEPQQAEFIFDYHADVMDLHQKEPVVKTESSELGKAIWIFILNYLFTDKGTTFNRKAFVKSTIEQMASHYNLPYTDLLWLFSEVLLHVDFSSKISTSLPFIIRELHQEEFNGETRRNAADTSDMRSAEAQELYQQIDLVRYFLVFGSLPWWSEPYPMDQLSEIFLKLINTLPNSVNEMIESAGQNQAVRKRIVRAFLNEVQFGLVRIVEPTHAGFIINYAADMYKLQVENTIIKTDSTTFNDTLWDIIFDFLLVERGSVFNTRMFLESNIRKLSQTYNLQYADLLAFIVQGISQAYQAETVHVKLFITLTDLLNDLNQAGKTAGAGLSITDVDLGSEDISHYLKSNREPAIASITGVGQGSEDHISLYLKLNGEPANANLSGPILLRNVLRHWIQYGTLPWWSAEHMNLSIDDLFNELIATAPQEAIWLLILAGGVSNTRHRIIYQLKKETLINLFSLLPQENNALGLTNYLLNFTYVKPSEGSIDSDVIQKMTLLIAWNAFIINDYKSFDPARFINAFVYHISKRTGQSIIALSAELESYIKLDPAAGYTDIVIKSLQGIRDFEALKSNELYVLPMLSASLSAEDLINGFLTNGKILERADMIGEALKILKYYLNNSRLPQQVDWLDDSNTDHFLKQIMLILYYERFSELNTVLQSDKYKGGAMMRLHEIFGTTSNIAEASVSKLLQPYFENNLLFYLSENRLALVNADKKLFWKIKEYINSAGVKQSGKILKVLLKHTATAGYLAQKLDDDTIAELFKKNSTGIGWGTDTLPFINEFQQFLQAALTDSLDRQNMAKLFREFNLLLLGGHHAFNGAEDYAKQFFKFISSGRYELINQLSFAMNKPGIDQSRIGPKIAAILPEIRKQINHNKHDTAKPLVTQLLTEADELALQRIYGANIQAELQKQMEVTKKEISKQQKNEEQLPETDLETIPGGETMYVNNAGLVLLNPFLSTYFTRLGLLIKSEFVSPQAQLKAVHLLQYLVYGTEKHPEQDLTLNKVLCNVPLQVPVPLEMKLSDQEKDVSNELLAVVISRWEKLNNTSAESFRNSFLQRTGALILTDGNWNLRVEQRGYDVLLQTLPWSFSMIKTSWMKNILYVEWT
ncbi:contractile injection system tape measure protein [Mucilaginibacter polytrichastri]|uniref:Uncharacterized protein n=1 Tax=Mucilaginibacter polytrichastri TaxID=1302689 RepID=A0A1Q5ZXM5_9SPHI|nr:contractile injection system tape measure protein [Mucilaginibacter polytrichastri]OKS86510.1 hypothetical protein RG47T_1966 [Mucilaginibacter polytrichastri]SFS79246.1 hypothetical protein SAMN04487890_10484 [Mucilaginibacter polytrichastri]